MTEFKDYTDINGLKHILRVVIDEDNIDMLGDPWEILEDYLSHSWKAPELIVGTVYITDADLDRIGIRVNDVEYTLMTDAFDNRQYYELLTFNGKSIVTLESISVRY